MKPTHELGGRVATIEIRLPESMSEIDQFATLVAAGVNAWKRAGEILVSMMDKDKDFVRRLRTAHPEISHDVIVVFERIGRNQLLPILLADSSAGARALAETPLEVQEKYSRELIPVSVRESGVPKVRMLRLSELNPSQVKQVFVGGRVLSPEEQDKSIMSRVGSLPAVQPVARIKRKETDKLGCYRISVTKDGAIVATRVAETQTAQRVFVSRPNRSDVEPSAYIMLCRSV